MDDRAPSYTLGFEDGVEECALHLTDYLNSLLDSGRLEAAEVRLVENILSHIENDLDSAAL